MVEAESLHGRCIVNEWYMHGACTVHAWYYYMTYALGCNMHMHMDIRYVHVHAGADIAL